MTEQNIIQISKHRCRNSPWHNGPFEVDEHRGSVECMACRTNLSPIAVLKFLSQGESTLNNRIATLERQLGNLENKKKCMCEHCGRMTIIDRSLN